MAVLIASRVQYTSWAFTDWAGDSGLVPSMGSIGDDNAIMESFWGRVQVELLGGDEPGRVGVLLGPEPTRQGVEGYVQFAEDEQEVAALHLAGRGRGDHDVGRVLPGAAPGHWTRGEVFGGPGGDCGRADLVPARGGRRAEHLLPAPLQLSHARRGELAHSRPLMPVPR